MALLVLFVCFVLQVRGNPYMTRADKPKVLAEHARKVLEGDALHRTIQSDMAAVHASNNKTRKAAGGGLARGKEEKMSAADVALHKVFDYNTVEAVLLGCCVLINLAGIMFNSGRFSGDLAAVNAQEYDALASATIALLGLSLIYYIACLAADLTVVCAPSLAARICTCRSVEAAVAKGRTRLAANARGGAGRSAREGKAIGSSASPRMAAIGAAGGGGGGGEDSSLVELQTNPILAAAMMDKRDTTGAAGGFGVNATDLETMVEPPGPEIWSIIRASYISSLAQVTQLQASVRALNKMAATRSSNGDGDDDEDAAGTAAAREQLAASTGRKKTTFTPIAQRGAGGSAAGGGVGAAGPFAGATKSSGALRALRGGSSSRAAKSDTPRAQASAEGEAAE
jgi:hypothetical protein